MGSVCASCQNSLRRASRSHIEAGQEWTGAAFISQNVKLAQLLTLALLTSCAIAICIAPEKSLSRIGFYSLLIFLSSSVPTCWYLTYRQLNREILDRPGTRSGRNPLTYFTYLLAQSDRAGALFASSIGAILMVIFIGLSNTDKLLNDFPSTFEWLRAASEDAQQWRNP